LDALVDQVIADHRGALAWDLFAGVGLFARRLTANFARVVAVESAPAATQALAETSRERRRPPCGPRPRFSSPQPQAVHSDSTCPDLVIVDPPRTGLGAETASCSARSLRLLWLRLLRPRTLARDLRALLALNTRYNPSLLPTSFPDLYLETVVHLRRS